MKRIWAQTRKELTQLLRDRLAVALAIGLPVMLLMLLGTAISLTVDDLPIVVQDFDSSTASRNLIDAFRGSITFRIVPWPVERDPEQAFTSNAARGAIVIPEHFGRDIARGINTPVQVLVDASDSNTAKLIAGYSAEVVSAYNDSTVGLTHPEPVQAAFRLWYNPGRSSKKFYGPGIFVLAISMFPPLLATLAMAKEGEQKTILQVYVSNISAHEFLLGKILAFMIVSMCECIVLMALLFTYFGLNIVGDPTPLVVSTILYAFCVAAFGTVVGAAVPNQVAATQAIALGGFLLVNLFSGLIFPIANIPPGLRWLSNFVWGKYYIEIVRDALLQGGGWPATWLKVIVIAAIGAVFYGMAWRYMRRMQLRS